MGKLDFLELKHLAPYLPYGLKVFVESDGFLQNKEYLEVNGITQNGVNVSTKSFPFNTDYCFDDFKPILRPLSDLTINEYWELSGKDKNKEFGFWYGKDINGEHLHFEGYSSRQIRKDRLNTLPYYAFTFLVENHFDVFGLIEKGLAIAQKQ